VGTCCLYFSAPAAPYPDNILYLNGTGGGLVNNACFPSTVSATYAPAGQVGRDRLLLWILWGVGWLLLLLLILIFPP